MTESFSFDQNIREPIADAIPLPVDPRLDLSAALPGVDPSIRRQAEELMELIANRPSDSPPYMLTHAL